MPVALVTGSAKGIGKALVLALAQDGYDVVVHYRNSVEDAEQVASLARSYGVKALALQANLSKVQEAEALVQQSQQQLKGLDVVVNNVGNYQKIDLHEVSPQGWLEIFDSNLHSTFYVSQAAAALMRHTKLGRIVNIAFAGSDKIEAKVDNTAYSIAKTGVLLYSKALALAEAPYGTTVNVISPGVIENSLSKPIDTIPMGRVGRFDEVVAAMRYFIASPYVTGVSIEVAGGWNL